MKIERVSEHIYSLGIWIVIPIHVWIVVEPDGLVLIDAGVGPMTKGILGVVESLNQGGLRKILLTHGHSDHVGAVVPLQRRLGIPAFVHPIEIPYMEGDRPYLRRKKARAQLPKGAAKPLELDAAGEPEAVGSLRPILTPGHSPGHVVYYHEEDDVVLAGDLFTSKKGRLRRPIPMFTGDMAEAVESSNVLRTLRPARLEVCHGDSPVLRPADQLDDYLAETKRLVKS